MNHLEKAKEIKENYISNPDVIKTTHLILDYFEEQYVKNNLEVLDCYIYFFINDTDINKQIKRNIHATLCFMNESKFINEITTKMYNYLN